MFNIQNSRQPDPVQTEVELSFTWKEWKAFRLGMQSRLLHPTIPEYQALRGMTPTSLVNSWDLGYAEMNLLLNMEGVQNALRERYEGEQDE